MDDHERLSRYLDGELQPEEQSETARRIAESPELRREFDALKALERTLQQQVPALDVHAPTRLPRARRPMLRAVGLAVAALLGVGAAGFAAVGWLRGEFRADDGMVSDSAAMSSVSA